MTGTSELRIKVSYETKKRIAQAAKAKGETMTDWCDRHLTRAVRFENWAPLYESYGYVYGPDGWELPPKPPTFYQRHCTIMVLCAWLLIGLIVGWIVVENWR